MGSVFRDSKRNKRPTGPEEKNGENESETTRIGGGNGSNPHTVP